MNWLNRVLGKEWTITPAGGLTGDAYIAAKKERRMFLKRNSSTFLAVLSAEGIVPKLIWTKRMENGDMITAQEWVDGRDLHREEMKEQHVADLLYKIHHSSELLHMLLRLGKQPMTPDSRAQRTSEKLRQYGLHEKEIVQQTLRYMADFLPEITGHPQTVCHCDLNHNNFLMTKTGELYLIDWENAAVADPAMDFGMVLKWYVPKSEWAAWLEKYGVTLDDQLLIRMYWYLMLDTLHYLLWHYERDESAKAHANFNDLQVLNDDIRQML